MATSISPSSPISILAPSQSQPQPQPQPLYFPSRILRVVVSCQVSILPTAATLILATIPSPYSYSNPYHPAPARYN
ncbi:uncharacterized protein STEHIDRAFT_121550 [Stereum hirsutum FP-91666 SS1]|uniref:uncharacterized protein n=1 Tax=Stereum hirsutum (strain FP-91666) TaxID=721885 RepID=UPI000440C967|nr:uncharacterized protein STEHIDRAFT_121550 [Stereum hirsutum FP-91666 SS1]EIM86677.1 hypothetical protein STEHIDRAFT_121550 [Stereum hirsutum FP-91666 SS1]